MLNFVLSALRAQWILIVLLLLVGAYGAYILTNRETLAPQTEGTVFIETPQIYTRERLVNDRFVQESWLRDVLKKDVSFTPSEVVSITDQTKSNLQIDMNRGSGSSGGASVQGGNSSVGGPPTTMQQPQIPPPLNFLMQNAYRELVRSHLIENQLDDRHDIRGTTIYLLKFDVSVVPGNNTRKPAFVHVHITRDESGHSVAPDASRRSSQGSPPASTMVAGAVTARADTDKRSRRPNSPQEYFIAYVDDPALFAGFAGVDDNPILQDFELYNQWQSSLKDRLNTALWDLLRRFDSNSFRFGEYTDFLSVLAEKSDKDRFSKSAILLSKLRAARDRVRAALSDGPAVAALDHRFHFIAKLLLAKAAETSDESAIEGADPSPEELEKLLTENAALPASPDEGKLREALLGYAVRRIGIAVVGDSSFKVEKLQTAVAKCPEASQQPAVIRSKTLDRFVLMQLCDPPGARTLPELDLIARQADLFSFRLKEVEQLLANSSEQDKCTTAADNKFGFRLISTYPTRDGETNPANFEFGAFRSDMSADIDDSSLPAYIFKPQNLARAFAKVLTDKGLTPHGECLPSAKGISLPVGFLNFVNQIVDMQTYTYATLPRIDLLVGDTTSDSAQADAVAVDGKTLGITGGLNSYYQRIARAVEPKSSVIGFSGPMCPKFDSRGCGVDNGIKDELNFGWMLSPPTEAKYANGIVLHRPMQPTQRSLSGLITVPTWWKNANVEVTTGWVNDDGSFYARDGLATSRHYSIPLPIDYESLDAILTEPGRRDSRKPSISLERLPENLYVQACERAEILVPGHRLWRSSVVVLGGQRADEVAVLPDMRGIIATFRPVNARAQWETGDRAVRALQVWTSEGVAGPVMVTVVDGKAACPPDSGQLAKKIRPGQAAAVEVP